MRPVELRLRNFRSYFGSETVLSFRDRRLVGIVGPIGSGKSSILDGISYGLFGRTPTVARSTKTLINQRADDAAVAVRFEIDGQLWEVVRSMRRRGQSQHALYRLDGDTEDPGHLEKVTGETDVNERVIALIGLEFDAFNRSVLLAQGRFAEFLRAPPRDRDAVLKGVFGHDRIDAMREVAKERARVAEADAEKVAFRVSQLEQKSTRLVEARAELVRWEERLAALEKTEPELETIAEDLAAAQIQLAEMQRRRSVLDAVAEGMPDPSTTDEQLAAIEQAAERREAAADVLEQATRAAESAARTSGEVDALAERATLDDATRLLAVLDQARLTVKAATENHERAVAERAAAQEAVERATLAETEAEQRLAVAREAAAVATESVANARVELHRAEHADMAATLRGGLDVGLPCPVCEQDVLEVPATDESPAGGAASEALQAAADHARTCDEGVTETAREHAAATSARQAATTELERLTGHADDLSQALAAALEAEAEAGRGLSGLLGVSDDFAATVRARRQSLTDALETETVARKALDSARAAHDEAATADQAAQATISKLQVVVAQLAARLGLAPGSGQSDSAGLRADLEQLRTSWLEESKQAVESMAALTTRVQHREQQRAALLAELEVSTSFAEELGSARARVDERRAEITRLEEELEASRGLVEERDFLVSRRDVMKRLASDLTDSRFIRFLLDEERSELADLGSEHLMRLTSGRYEFDQSGSFDIVDLAASESIRKADSLSGGETFLASLGLALALAEMVARTGGRLESFFLDEGFGSLDPEHLDLAMEGIEALASDRADRLVVVVSHVPELRHRIEDLIELERSPTTGDTRVVRA